MILPRTRVCIAIGVCAIGMVTYCWVQGYAQSGLESVPPEPFESPPAEPGIAKDERDFAIDVDDLPSGIDKYGRTPMEIRFLWKPGMNPDNPGFDEMELLDNRPKIFKRVQQEILRQYAEANDETTRAKLKSYLQRAVLEEFESRQRSRKRELDRLENELNRLLELHKTREKQKNRIVSGRVEQLIRDFEGLGWGSHDSLNSTK